jgi:uncharacterized protein with PQ loop repeat
LGNEVSHPRASGLGPRASGLGPRASNLIACYALPIFSGVTAITTFIGWIAVVLTQVFYIPNTLKILRTRDVQGYSLVGWSLLTTGLACYLVYFIAQSDVVGIVANCCGIAGAGLTTFCIWLWRPRAVSDSAEGLATANQG